MNKRINLYQIILFIICAFYINLFYLLDSSKTLIGVSCDEISWVLIVGLLVMIGIKNYKTFFSLSNNKLFLIVFSVTFLLAITSSYQGMVRYNQPFLVAFFAQRRLLIYPFLFLIYSYLIREKRISIKEVKNVLKLFTFIEIVLGFIQYFLGDSYQLLYVDVTSRYGTMRFFMEISLPIFTAFICLNDIFDDGVTIKNIAIIILTFLYQIVIVKWRMPVISFAISMVVVSLLNNKLNYKIKFSILILSLITIIVFLNTSMGKDIWGIVSSNETIDTLDIRERGKGYFSNVIQDNLLLGGGFINKKWISTNAFAYELSGQSHNYFSSDNGLIGYTYIYGILGLSFVLLFHIYALFHSYKIYKKDGNISLIGYLLYSLIGCSTVFMLGMGEALVFPIFLIFFLYYKNNN